MIIIWKGLGFLVPIIVIAVGVLLTPVLTPLDRYCDLPNLTMSLSLIIAAIPIWFLGKRLHKNATRILVDPNTGQQIRLISTHSFFWIRMEYWAPICVVLGIMAFITAFVVKTFSTHMAHAEQKMTVFRLFVRNCSYRRKDPPRNPGLIFLRCCEK